MDNKIYEYCEKVCNQVRWKKAHKSIARELESHILDLKDKYISLGDSDFVATDKAILEMGEADNVGLEFDRTHKPEPQWLTLSLSFLVIFVGAFFKFLDSPANFNYFAYILAISSLFGCYFLDFTILGKYSDKIFLSIVILPFLLSFIHIDKINGYSYFFRVPLEMFAIIFPVAYAIFIYYIREKGMKSMIYSIIAYVFLAMILLLISVPSAVFTFSIIAYCILLFATYKGFMGVDRKKGCAFLIISAILGTAIVCLLMFLGYGQYRVNGILNMQSDVNGSGFIYNLLRGTLSELRLFGEGELKFLINHESWTEEQLFLFAPSGMDLLRDNFWLSYASYRYGAIVFIVVAVLIISFSVIAIKKSVNQNSILGSLVSLSISTTFLIQSMIYFVENLSYGFVASISLPLISGSNYILLINAGLVGFMLSVFKNGDMYSDLVEE